MERVLEKQRVMRRFNKRGNVAEIGMLEKQGKI